MSAHSSQTQDATRVGTATTKAKKATSLAILGHAFGTLPPEVPLTDDEVVEHEAEAQRISALRKRNAFVTGTVDPVMQLAPRRAFFG